MKPQCAASPANYVIICSTLLTHKRLSQPPVNHSFAPTKKASVCNVLQNGITIVKYHFNYQISRNLNEAHSEQLASLQMFPGPRLAKTPLLHTRYLLNKERDSWHLMRHSCSFIME